MYTDATKRYYLYFTVLKPKKSFDAYDENFSTFKVKGGNDIGLQKVILQIRLQVYCEICEV